MSRQFNEAMEGHFKIYGKEYKIVDPTNFEELVQAMEAKSALETYLSALLHDEDPGIYPDLLEEQEGYITEYLSSLPEYDNSTLVSNIRFFLRKYNLRMGDLEQILGISPGYISRTVGENAGKRLSIDVVWQMSRLFGVNIRSLLEDDLSAARSNNNLINAFLAKLCDETDSRAITWENLGGATIALRPELLTTGLFTEAEDGGAIYHCADHMNPDWKFVLARDVYVCLSIKENKAFAIITFWRDEEPEREYTDFVFLTREDVDGEARLIAEKAFYWTDDPFCITADARTRLVDLIINQDFDAKISQDVKHIMMDYLM